MTSDELAIALGEQDAMRERIAAEEADMLFGRAALMQNLTAAEERAQAESERAQAESERAQAAELRVLALESELARKRNE